MAFDAFTALALFILADAVVVLLWRVNAWYMDQAQVGRAPHSSAWFDSGGDDDGGSDE